MLIALFKKIFEIIPLGINAFSSSRTQMTKNYKVKS
jgi:hypothetical protein